MNVKFLQAENGDSILISLLNEQGQKTNILIDGGMPICYQDHEENILGDLRTTLDEIKSRNPKEKIDLLILTHIDEDHIGGILNWFESDKEAYALINKVWFNSGKSISEHLKIIENPELEVKLNIFENSQTSVRQAVKFENYLINNSLWDKEIIKSPRIAIEKGLTITILSPDIKRLEKLVQEYKVKDKNYFTSGEVNDYKTNLFEFIEEEKKPLYKESEDDRPVNGSSIAFILTYEKKNYIFLGDAFPSVVYDALKELGHSDVARIKAEFLKISHHGSHYNTSKKLLSLIETENYIISTDGRRHGHPHKRTMARIIGNNPNANIYFNYEGLIARIFSDEDHEAFPNFNAMKIETYPI